MATEVLFVVLLLVAVGGGGLSIVMAQPSSSSCIPNLQELALRTRAEANEVLAFGNATRAPPYRYILCPDTVFSVESDQDPILPILDETFILCGEDGASTNNCVVEENADGTFVAALTGLVQGYTRFSTVFSGITFKGQVIAVDFAPTRVSFIDCIWKDIPGTGFLFLSVGEFVGIIPGMYVELVDCIMENEAFALPEGQAYNASSVPLFSPTLNFGGTLVLTNVTVKDIHASYFTFGFVADTTIQESFFSKSSVAEGLLVSSALLAVSNSRFADVSYVVGSISGVDAAIESIGNTFERNSGLADVVSLASNRTAEEAYLLGVSDSCFLDGDYLAGPIFLGGNGITELENIHVDGNTSGDCPAQPFIEGVVGCFDEDSFLLEDQPCLGECGTDATFDAETCSFEEECADTSSGRNVLILEKIRGGASSRQGCAWLEDQDEDTVEVYCSNFGKVRRGCRTSCDTCRPKGCQDKGEDFSFATFDTQLQSCAWLARRNTVKQKKLCKFSPQAKELCPVTCNSCPK